MHNDTLLIVEKLHHAKLLIEAAGDLLNAKEVDILDFRGLGFKYYDIPSRLPISEAPLITPIKWKYRDLSMWDGQNYAPGIFHRHYGIKTKNLLKISLLSESNVPSWEEQVSIVSNKLPNYKRIIVMPDMDTRGVFFANQLLDELLKGYTELPRVDWIDTGIGMDGYSLRGQVEAPKDISLKIAKYQAMAEVKYYFDWLWFINSAPVFGKAMKLSNISTDHILSKYELLSFLLIAKGEVTYKNLNELTHQLFQFKGSGKYHVDDYWLYIGSPSSISTIADNLAKMEIIDDQGLTEKGRIFASHIHKRSLDPDLSPRIYDWSVKGDYKAVEKYIQNFFKKQKNFNSTKSL